MPEVTKEEFFKEVAEREGISVNGVVSLGVFFINDKGDLFTRIDGITSAIYVIHADKLNCMKDFDSSIKVYWSTMKMICKKSDKNDFDNAFVIAWYRSSNTDKSYILAENIALDLILASTIETRESQSYIADDDTPDIFHKESTEFLRFIYLADLSEKELMHYNGFLNFNLREPYVEGDRQPMNCVSLFFHVNIENLFHVTSPMSFTLFRPDFLCKGDMMIETSELDWGFSAFIINFIANVYHRNLLCECWREEGAELFKKQCFANSNTYNDDDLFSWPVPDIATPVKEIFEEYINTIIPYMQAAISKDVSIDLLEYDGDKWWNYVYEQELAMWEHAQEKYVLPLFADDTATVISQYVIQFLNYLNFKFSLGKTKLSIPVSRSIFSEMETIHKKDFSDMNKESLMHKNKEIPYFNKYFRDGLSDAQRIRLEQELQDACRKEHAAEALASYLCSEVNRATYLSIDHITKTTLYQSLKKSYQLDISSSAFSHAMANHEKSKNHAK